MTDESEIIRKAQNGDDRAFGELVRLHQREAHLLALRLTRNQEEAADISQTAFIQAYRGLRGFKGEAGFSTWLYRITYNIAMRRMGSVWWRKWLPLEDGAVGNRQSSSDPERESEKDNFRRQAEAAIGVLPTQMRAVFSMHQIQGLKLSEVAEIMGKSEGNIKALHYHAVRKLREALKEWKGAEFGG